MYKMDNINTDGIRDELLKLIKSKVITKYNDKLHNIEERLIAAIQLLENNWHKVQVRLLRDTAPFMGSYINGIELGIKNKFKRYCSIIQIIPIFGEEWYDDYWEVTFPTIGCYIQLENKTLDLLLPILEKGAKRYTLKWYLHNTEGNIFKKIYNWWNDIIL